MEWKITSTRIDIDNVILYVKDCNDNNIEAVIVPVSYSPAAETKLLYKYSNNFK